VRAPTLAGWLACLPGSAAGRSQPQRTPQRGRGDELLWTLVLEKDCPELDSGADEEFGRRPARHVLCMQHRESGVTVALRPDVTDSLCVQLPACLPAGPDM
jgi:hypothetical protein